MFAYDAAPGQEGVYWVILSLALTGASLALATALSCRGFVSFSTKVLRTNPMRSASYRSFFSHHSTYWWLMGVAVVAHLMLAIVHTADSDADAGVPVASLALGAGIIVSNLAILSSCRIIPRLVGKGNSLLNSAGYVVFLKYHSYLWLVFGVIVGAHMAVGLSRGF